MHLPRFDYVRPDDAAHAVQLLGEWRNRAALLAGGTDLLTSMSQRLVVPEVVIGIGGLRELQGVTPREDGGLTLGAGTRLSTLLDDALLAARFPTLRRALGAVASRHVRNMATLGGNLVLPTRCWYTNQTAGWREARAGCFKTDQQACHVLATSDHCVATSSADSAPALIAFGASVRVRSVRGERTIPLDAFYRDDGAQPTVLAPDELITAVEVPPCGDRMAFVKVTPREGIDFGLGTIAVAIRGTNRRVTAARIVVNTFGPRPTPLHEAEGVILGGGLTPAAIEAAAGAARAGLGEITNLWSPAGYKRRLVRSLLRRALEEIRRQKAPEGTLSMAGTIAGGPAGATA